MKDALLFKKLATLKTNVKLFKKVDELKWRGPTTEFAKIAKKLGDDKLMLRVEKVSKLIAP